MHDLGAAGERDFLSGIGSPDERDLFATRVTVVQAEGASQTIDAAANIHCDTALCIASRKRRTDCVPSSFKRGEGSVRSVLIRGGKCPRPVILAGGGNIEHTPGCRRAGRDIDEDES